jgi:hypothetical protein
VTLTTIQSVLDTLDARLALVDGPLVGRSLGKLVRGEELEAKALVHRPALLRLAFMAHVWAPALEAGALVTSAMRAQLLESGAMATSELLDDLQLLLDSFGDGGAGGVERALIPLSLERGFIGDRAGVALKAPELFALSDDDVERMLAMGVPRAR